MVLHHVFSIGRAPLKGLNQIYSTWRAPWSALCHVFLHTGPPQRALHCVLSTMGATKGACLQCLFQTWGHQGSHRHQCINGIHSAGFPTWRYPPCCHLSAPLLLIPFALVLYLLPALEKQHLWTLRYNKQKAIIVLLKSPRDSWVKQSVCNINEASLTWRSLSMSPTCKRMPSWSLLRPVIKVCLRSREWEAETQFYDFCPSLLHFHHIKFQSHLRALVPWLDTTVFCRGNRWNKLQRKLTWKLSLEGFLLTVRCVSYLCVWWGPQIFKTIMTLLRISILHMKWKKTVKNFNQLSGMQGERKKERQRRRKGKKEERSKLKQWSGSCCCVLWVQRKPRLWLQSDAMKSWRGRSFM